jgi:segregation and condensation protein B
LLKQIVEAALVAAGGPLTLDQLLALFLDDERPSRAELLAVIAALHQDYADRGLEIVEVAGGWRTQVRASIAPWVARLWDERPPRYSRALLETLSLIAYRQPITRGEIEDIRGVAVSTQIVKTLTEREWIRVVGHRDVPGRPALFATTRKFLDYFGLRSLNELPTLAEIRAPDFLIDEELTLESPTLDAADKKPRDDSGV